MEDRENGITSTLLDYSYAGYHFSEKEIPDVSAWPIFNVVDYGAVADDEGYDDAGIQAAIDAAVATEKAAVVYFPSGRFIVSEDNNTGKYIKINGDSIVLKGAGSGEGGTEIYMDKRRVVNGHWQFKFSPATTSVATLATITAPIKRGDFTIYVDNAASLSEDQVIHIYHKSPEFAEFHFGELELDEDWTRLFGSGGGMAVYEPHIIERITGNRVTFKNPIQADMPELSRTFVVRELTTIHEVGVEDILFVSGWESYGETFVHHKDDIHDYGWSAVQFENVRDGWMRNCVFRSWSQSVNVSQSIGVTVQDVTLNGEKGHASFSTRRGYGLMVKDCIDEAGQHHGPGTGYQGVNTVYLRHTMQSGQSVDSHSGQPYATLIDDTDGGDFDQNGGPIESYPHHGQDFTFWNFRHNTDGTRTYDFWPADRNGNTYAHPLFIGFQPNASVIFLDEGLDEARGEMVSPKSLFEAQLNLRVTEQSTLPSVKIMSPTYQEEKAIGADVEVIVEASDPDGTISSVSLFLNDVLVRSDTEAPFSWGGSNNDEALDNLAAGIYWLKATAMDDADNVSSDSIEIIVGSLPIVSFLSPSKNQIKELGKSVLVEASATDSDGSIVSASLYLDGELVRTLTSTPYVWGESTSSDPALLNFNSGEHTLKLSATDNDGLSRSITRSFIGNAFPVVSFSSPHQDSIFVFGGNAFVEVDVTDADGDIEYVALYLNDDFLRQDISAPFTWGARSDADPDLFDMLAGDYTLKAIAFDSLGSSGSSELSFSVSEEVIPLALGKAENTSVFPNPFIDYVVLTNVGLATNFKLIDLQGRDLTEHIQITQTESSVSVLFKQLESGMYFLQYQEDSKFYIVRLIKR